jgi:hypothetical protein
MATITNVKAKTSFERLQEDIGCGRVFVAKDGKDLIDQCLKEDGENPE